MLVADQFLQPLGDLHLAVGGLCHADFVNCQGDQRGTVGERDRHDRVELVAAGLEVDRVDDCPAGNLLEGGLDHLGFG